MVKSTSMIITQEQMLKYTRLEHENEGLLRRVEQQRDHIETLGRLIESYERKLERLEPLEFVD